VNAKLKEKTEGSILESPVAVTSSVIASVEEEDLPHVGCQSTLLKTIQRAKVRNLPPNPESTSEIVIADSFLKCFGQPWIAVDEIVNGKRLLAFATQSSLDELTNALVM
jgi:hypothetical protein